MSETKIQFYQQSPAGISNMQPSTCTEAETFVLQVLDDSMEPEFNQHCMIVIDPTGHAKDGSYVLAKRKSASLSYPTMQNQQAQHVEEVQRAESKQNAEVEQFHFRQLRYIENEWWLCSLNDNYSSEPTPSDFTEIVGVIVQRAGKRRRFHKRYD